MQFFAAYGLTLESEFALDTLVPASGPPDVLVRLARLPHDQPDAAPSIVQTPGGLALGWPGAGVFEVRAGRLILVDPAPGASTRKLQALLLGPVLAVLLHQRGFLVLHASAVAVNGAVIAFLGDSGSGKSTIAAALCAAGHVLVADDLVPVRPESQEILVSPGFPRVSLWPPATAAIGAAAAHVMPLHEDTTKVACLVTATFATVPLPLARLYVVGAGPAHAVHALGAQDQMVGLIRNTYGVRTLHAASPAPHLRRCARLAERVSIRRLEARRALDGLSSLVGLVLEDALTAA